MKNPEIDPVIGEDQPDSTRARTVRRQRALQRARDASDQAAGGTDTGNGGQPVNAGYQTYPSELPAQHITKPGEESELRLRPHFLAPDYEGSGKLEGMVALITGADSGIGRAVAVLFAREGADIAVVYLNEHADAQATQRCIEVEGRECLLLPGDVTDSSFCELAVKHTVEAFGQLDVLVNNAAFQQHAQSIEDISNEQLDETLRTNVCGYFYMARAAVPYLQEGASIINTGSVVGLRGSGHLLDYASTKGAIHAFTKSLAQNLVDKGIRVNAVAPGPVWTPLTPADAQADRVATFGRNTDMKRVAQPEEISPAFVFLASPVCSSYITGIVLPVTGTVEAN